ncbi:MAG: energy transducer TonB [Bacteroidaceae bacterium]|nr:energy transducer TonB [Bacteroidaceae bacterium]
MTIVSVIDFKFHLHRVLLQARHYGEIVERNAEFPGGERACMEWLSRNMKYPEIALEQGIRGRVIVQFVVNRDGSIGDKYIIKSPHPSLSDEVLRLFTLMPKWRPATMGNHAVRSRLNLPVNFTLR